MKFCPKCGAQLVDEARFCSKCGAPQPNMENNPAPQAEPVVEQPIPQPEVVQQPVGSMTPAQRYRYLKQNDERFKDTIRVIFLLKFVGLISLLFIIPWLVNYLTPVGTLTGYNPSDVGANMMYYSNKQFPYNFSVFDLSFTFIPWAKTGNYKLTPDNAIGNNIMPTVLWYFGWLFMVLIALVSMLGMSKGYVLKTYEQDEGKALFKQLKSNSTWFFGPAYALISLIMPVMTSINCKDLDYEPGKVYLLGEVEQYKPGLITCIIVTLIFMGIMLAGSIVLRKLLFKKIEKYYK